MGKSLGIYLGIHIFCDYICTIIFDLSIREFNIIHHGIRVRVAIIGSNDIAILISSTNYNFGILHCLPLRKIHLSMYPTISDRIFIVSCAISINWIIILR